VPELPEVQALAEFLTAQAGGRTVERVDVAALSVLKTYDPPVSALVGHTFEAASRRGKYLCLRIGPRWLVLHLSRAGWVHWREQLSTDRVRMGKGPLALRVALSDGVGFDVTEQGTERRVAAWVVTDPVEVEGVSTLGPDPLVPPLQLGTLAEILSGSTSNLKTVLTDQSLIAGVGNAYSDEILHAARLSPFKTASKLTSEEVERLHASLVGILGEAVERSAGLPAKGLKGEKRSSMSVHGRAGLPCPVCGDTVLEVSLSNKSFQYCPTCQTGGRHYADRRLSRLLK